MSSVIQILSAIAFGLILALLVGCDGEVERLQREADFNAKLARAAMPKYGEPRICEWVADNLVCYTKGRKRQPDVVAAREDIP